MLDSVRLTTPDQFRAIGDATRMRILGRLAEGPASIQQVARALRTPKGTIGHHVGVLDDAGLIRVVEERRVRGVTERRYGRVARMSRVDAGGELAEAVPDAPPLQMLPLRQAIDEARSSGGAGDPSMSVIARGRMPAARARRFAKLLEELADEFGKGASGKGETYGFAAAVYLPDWSATRARR